MPMTAQKPERPQMVMGWGQSDTHAVEVEDRETGEVKPNPHKQAGLPYSTITGQDIATMAKNPHACEKSKAPWFIASTYAEHDARVHDKQREKGEYHILPVDIDKGAIPFDQVQKVTAEIIGPDHSHIIYSSSSATAENPKWRVLIFLGTPVSGADYHDTQGALFGLYADKGITCDQALDRPGQLVFLPNVPPDKRGPDGEPLFYHHHLHRAGLLYLDDAHPIIARREAIRADIARAEEEARARRSTSVARRDTDEISPVDAFNRDHFLPDLMRDLGYKQQGNSKHYQSPLQTSGSYAVMVVDDQSWVSLSGSDQAAGIGNQKEHCCWGDAFDLYAHFKHGGDHTAAVRAYGQIIRPSATIVPLRAADSLAQDFGEPELPDTPQEPQERPKDSDDCPLLEWTFLTGDNEFYHAATGRSATVSAFNLSMGPQTPMIDFEKPNGETVRKKLAAAKTLIDYLGGEVAHATMYRPDVDATHFDYQGIPFLNSYRPSTVPAADDDWRDNPAWRICADHIRNILNDDAELIIQWMAHNVQFPGKKILWAPIIVGVQGDGKTTLSKMLAFAMGAENVSPVSPETMFSDFTGWAEGSCVKILEEIRVHGNSRHNAMNKLKPLITNDVVEIVRKGKDGKQVVNVTNYMALTNFMDALALDEGDRRWGVFKTKFEDRTHMLSELDDDYWDALHSAIDRNPGAIRAWLLNVDLTSFNRVKGPEVNAHKLAMIEQTRSPDVADIAEAINLGWHGVHADALATDCLNTAIQDHTGKRLDTTRIARALAQLGWVKRDEVVKWKNKTRRIYIRKAAFLGRAENAEIRKLLDASEGPNDL